MGARKATTKIVAVQLLITLLAVAACFALANVSAAYSAAVGGGISVIVTASFAVQVFAGSANISAAKITRRFYVGEAIKIALTAVLFFIAITGLQVSFLPLFLTYAATLLAYWLVLPFTLDASVRSL